MSAELWTEEELGILKANYSKGNLSYLCKELGRTSASVTSKVFSLRREGFLPPIIKNVNLNHSFFRVPNLINSYWAGFIAADGHLDARKRQTRLVIHLSSTDHDHLYQFSNTVGHRYGVKLHKNNKSYLQISSKYIVEDLTKVFNIPPGYKSLIIAGPRNLSIENQFSFIVGYIDGDGCITSEPYHKTSRRYPVVQIIGTDLLLNWIKTIFVDTFKNDYPKILHKGRVSSFKFSGSKAKEIVSFLAKVSVPKLERKWSRDHLKRHGFIEGK